MISISSRRAVVTGLTVLLAAGVACGGGDKGTKQPGEVAAKIVTTTTTAAPPTTSSTAPPVAANFDDLSRLILTTVPAEYKVQPNDVGDTGPSDLDKAVSDDGGDDARAVLTGAGFVRGYQRYWSKSDEEEVVAFLYQFKDNAGAASYAKRMTDDLDEPQDGITLTRFDVPGIEGAVGITAHDSTFAGSVVAFTKGPYLVQLMVNGVSQAGQADFVKRLATDQFSRL